MVKTITLFVNGFENRGEATMLVKLSIILFSNSHNFTYYSQNYAWLNAHGISGS